MLTKIDGKKFTLLPKTPKENERLCDVCGDTGWLLDEEKGFIKKCKCEDGVISICRHCGKDLKWGNCDSSKCRKKRNENNELNRVEEAKHYTLDNCPKKYMEFFYSDNFGYDNGYMTDIDLLEDYCKDNYIEMPKYVWGTSKQEFILDADEIVTQPLEESYEESHEHVNQKELDKLQTACDEFIKAHNGVLDSYYVNYDVCIDLEDCHENISNT